MQPFRNVKICYSPQTVAMSKFHPKFDERYVLTMSLIESYNLLSNTLNCSYDIEKSESYIQNLTSFHSLDYLKLIYKLSKSEEASSNSDDDDDLEVYGLQFDCFTFSGLYDFCLSSVCNTMTAAKSIVANECLYAINWHGGWHHAKKDEASGFCYVNDIVYGIMILMKRFHRVLYVDIDLHHGDGVEEAFLHTSKVFTLSFHYSSTGFFPPTCVDDDYCTGFGKGRYAAARFPFRQEGVTDAAFISIFDVVFDTVVKSYDPDVIVFQCGTDGLVTDPHKIFGLTHVTFEHVASKIIQTSRQYPGENSLQPVPVLILGGGGYNFIDSAIVWTRVTARFLGVELPEDIPTHEYMDRYSPCYELLVNPPMRKYNENKQETERDLNKIRELMQNYCTVHTSNSSNSI